MVCCSQEDPIQTAIIIIIIIMIPSQWPNGIDYIRDDPLDTQKWPQDPKTYTSLASPTLLPFACSFPFANRGLNNKTS